MQSPNLRFLWENKSLVKQHGFVSTDSGGLSAEIGCGAGPSEDAGLPGLCLLALGGVLSLLASQGTTRGLLQLLCERADSWAVVGSSSLMWLEVLGCQIATVPRFLA